MEVLSVEARVTLAAAVTEADVEQPVGTEGELAAVVVGEGMRHDEQQLGRGRAGAVGVARADRIAHHAHVV